MSALFKPKVEPSELENWTKLAARRSSPAVVRMRAYMFLSYHAATGAKESDSFQCNAKTWALFEHAVLPELENFTFFDRSSETYLTPSAVLADAMFQFWTAAESATDTPGQTTTISVVSEMADYLCSLYKTTRIEGQRSWLTARWNRS